MVDPITSAIITVSQKGIVRIDFRDVENEIVTANFSFPSAVPSDAKHWPFLDIARVSQAKSSSEIIPCIRLQIRERALPDRNLQRWARRFLLAFRRLWHRENSRRKYPRWYGRDLLIQANRLLVPARMTGHAAEFYSADEINKSSRLNKISASC
jgi:hypothetical protein